MSKRILFTTETLSLGGIQRVTSVIVNALYRHGKDVTLYCLDNAKQDFYHVDAPVVRFDSTGKRYIKRLSGNQGLHPDPGISETSFGAI